MSKELYEAFSEWHVNCIIYEKSLKDAFAAGFCYSSDGHTLNEALLLLSSLDKAIENNSVTESHHKWIKAFLRKHEQ